MATETDVALAEALRAFVENAAQAKNFATEQAPEVIQELLRWAIVDAAVGLAMASGGLYVAYRLGRWGWGAMDREPTEISGVLSCAAGSLLSLVAAISFIINFSRLLKVLLAPKVYLLEYAARLVN